MKYLEKELRNILENSILRARKISEEAAEIAIRQLGVEKSSPYEYLSEQERILRRRLRAHGRQLGDLRDSKEETQEIDRLIEEVAYEHWHRMLFAKFLFENNLLMYFEDDDIENAVSISFEECEEISKELGLYNGWELASKLAAKMLPQIFRADSPVFELKFPIEKEMELEKIIYELPKDIFGASDSLGWVYQFWQKNKKDEVNKSEVKIGARELPAVTQLFTEPYMVSFLIDNSLGSWWAKKILTREDLVNLETEEELRAKLQLGDLQFDYTRFVKNCEGWSIAGENTEGWPEELSELRMIDPCCGSGHFLVSFFQKLVPIRMYLENISAKDACDKVLIENIHGLEIDQRCVELAAFAIALTAWKYPKAGGFRALPELNIAWCGQSVNVNKEEWLALADRDSDLKIHLEALYDLFENAPILGSLLNPRNYFEVGSVFEKEWDTVSKLLQAKFEKKKNENDGLRVVAQGMEKSFQLLGDKYHLVATNVPYLGKGKMSSSLRKYVEENFDEADDDLATSMMMRCINFCTNGGILLFVTSKNWMFIKTFEKFRIKLLNRVKWEMVIDLGYKAFSTQMYDFPVCMTILSNKIHKSSDTIISLKTGDCAIENKIDTLKESIIKISHQEKQNNNPQHRILFDIDFNRKLTGDFVKSTEGLSTGDSDRFIAYFWENTNSDEQWEFYQTSPSNEDIIDGCSKVIFWQNGNGELSISKAARIQGNYAWGKKGIIIGRVGQIRANVYLGYPFDKSSVVLTPKNNENLSLVYNFAKTDSFKAYVRGMDSKLGVATSVFENVPFEIEEGVESCLENMPIPYSDDPCQWIFHGHPAYCGAPLQVAVARLLGYRWPAEVDNDMELSVYSRELVKQCDKLLPYEDEDGIVCIPSVRGELSASERLLNLLAEAYKGQNINTVQSELLVSCDYAGKSLESWLRNKFFSQHMKLFNNRPFIWQVWDGLPDGFSALLNYHKLNIKNLETLIYTYLGDWINKQKNDIKTGMDGAEEKLAAAETLKKSLELVLYGDQPYDIFVRWKTMDKQPIGWNPDINDGVRLNIRPFMSVPDIGKKGAGILRDKPNISWNKDRGKDTTDSPWYKVFNGERINDYHLSLEEKLSARGEKR